MILPLIKIELLYHVIRHEAHSYKHIVTSLYRDGKVLVSVHVENLYPLVSIYIQLQS